MTIVSDLLHAGVAPDLVARVADAIEAARSEGVDMSLKAMRSEAAGRQARYRDRRQRNVTSDVKSDVTNDVTSDVTASRTRAFLTGEEREDITPLGSLSSPTLPRGRSTKKGTRLSEEWTAAEPERAFGRDLGLSDAQISAEQGQFKDFWRGVPGQRGHKLDWAATFRNRLRDVAARAQLRKSNGKGSIVDAGRKLTERLIAAERERELQALNRVDDGDPAFRFLPPLGRQRP